MEVIDPMIKRVSLTSLLTKLQELSTLEVHEVKEDKSKEVDGTITWRMGNLVNKIFIQHIRAS
jgi:hypothetical protein